MSPDRGDDWNDLEPGDWDGENYDPYDNRNQTERHPQSEALMKENQLYVYVGEKNNPQDLERYFFKQNDHNNMDRGFEVEVFTGHTFPVPVGSIARCLYVNNDGIAVVEVACWNINLDKNGRAQSFCQQNRGRRYPVSAETQKKFKPLSKLR